MADIHVSAAVILNAAGHLLVVRKHGTRVFMQPGGKPEPGETPAETLVRELQEELGIEARVDELVPLGVFRAPAANEAGHDVVAEVFSVPGDWSPHAAAEIAEWRWLSTADIERLGDAVAPLITRHFATLVR